MDIYYLKDHMFEEVCGAKEYIQQAMDLKDVNGTWSKMFFDMGKTEMDHASALYKMLDEHYKQINTKPELAGYMEPFKREIDESYMKKVGAVKYMIDMYLR